MTVNDNTNAATPTPEIKAALTYIEACFIVKDVETLLSTMLAIAELLLSADNADMSEPFREAVMQIATYAREAQANTDTLRGYMKTGKINHGEEEDCDGEGRDGEGRDSGE
ncbi:MAG: hypothetical protein P8Y47_11405 [Alphaproteobacteria bacterium]